MGVISTTILVIGGIGVLAAIVLYFVAKKFYVYENPKIAEIEELLPGANCGGCGMSGCHAFAKACAETDSLDGFNCTGAGKDIMEKISVIVGLEAKAGIRRVAVMKCNGGCSERQIVNNYDGVTSCAMEGALYQGETDCNYGCLGRGDCVASCIFDALHIDSDSGIAVVDHEKCVGCGKCVNKKPWEQKVDIALPCATQNELCEEDAKKLIANNVLLVAEVSNMGCTAEAIDAFISSKTPYAPGKAVNAGGVAVSGLEMTQDAEHLQWSAQKVDDMLHEIMFNIHEACVEHGREEGYINYMKGANIAGFLKVADAMMAQGVI